MKNVMKITINKVSYAVELVGPVTTLLIRGDGAYVHADTVSLNHMVKK